MKRVKIDLYGYMKRQETEEQIRAAGCKPKVCPRCGCHVLWPKEREAMNALSRTDNKTYVCSPCGRGELMNGGNRR